MDLVELLIEKMQEKNFLNDKYKTRLKEELKEINLQQEQSYFLNLYTQKIRYPKNEHNLLIPYLLDICNDFDISKDPAWSYGEFPDIDCDYLPIVRDYLKDEWAAKTFGTECVANVGSYNTFGIKSALQSMARVHGKDIHEIIELTKEIDLKDEDGKPITWEKALELYPGIKQYCTDNPDVAAAAKKLLNKNNSMGKHAGGLIISDRPLSDFVPLVKGKDGNPVTAWTEGLHGQDLGPVGLVKFDVLGVSNLMRVAVACKLIKQRHQLTSICALPNNEDWSDTGYLNDPKALAIANQGNLKCIFQFDSDGIRNLTKNCGVDCFEDLVAITSIYRPGPIMGKFHEVYTKRKKDKDTEYEEKHPLLDPILGETYYCIIYQEQIMRILNIVGEIPLKDCQVVIKAISKKKVELFKDYKDLFIKNGQKNLGWEEDKIKKFWQQIENFATYSFNKCLTGNNLIACIPINSLIKGTICKSWLNKELVDDEVEDVFETGEKQVYRIELKNGMEIETTLDHKFLCSDDKFHDVWTIFKNDLEIKYDEDNV